LDLVCRGIKFLVPLSFSVIAGQALEWRTSPRIAHQSIAAVAEISMPFEPPAEVFLPPAPFGPEPDWVSTMLLGIWVCGFMISVGFWTRSWWRVRIAVCAAVPLHLELRTDAPVRTLSSPILFEPAVVGISKPVLLLPDGIVERMDSGTTAVRLDPRSQSHPAPRQSRCNRLHGS
jgi:hypothetical protein